MQSLALGAPRHDVDAWLRTVVAGVLEKADVIRIDRSELWSLLDNLPVAILISSDRECSRIVGNIAAQALLEVPLGSNLSQSAPANERPRFKVYSDGECVHPDDLPMQRAALSGRRVARSECEIRFNDGRSIFIAGHCIPIMDQKGQPCGSIGAFVDVSEQHARQQVDALIAMEMSHRVKNTVALIQALASSTLKPKLDVADYKAFEQRLINLAHAQGLVAKTAVAAISLCDLVLAAIRAVAPEKMDRVHWHGAEIQVAPDMIQPLTMVFHELVTNACKYGAFKHDGQLTISWTINEGVIVLQWQEMNVSNDEGAVGFGSKMIEAIINTQLKGEIVRSFSPNKLKIELTFKA